jgi:hypothetical protein
MPTLFLQACHRHRTNQIDQLAHHGAVFVEEQHKAEIIFQHFDYILGSSDSRQHGLDFVVMGLLVLDLPGLDVCFSEEEIWSVVRALPADNATGPNGFLARFYRSTLFGHWITGAST